MSSSQSLKMRLSSQQIFSSIGMDYQTQLLVAAPPTADIPISQPLKTDDDPRDAFEIREEDLAFLDSGLRVLDPSPQLTSEHTRKPIFSDNQPLAVLCGDEYVKTFIANQCKHPFHPASPMPVLHYHAKCSVCSIAAGMGYLKSIVTELEEKWVSRYMDTTGLDHWDRFKWWWKHKKTVSRMRKARAGVLRGLQHLTKVAEREMDWNNAHPACLDTPWLEYSAVAALGKYSKLEAECMATAFYPYARAEQITQPERVMKRKRDDDDLDGVIVAESDYPLSKAEIKIEEGELVLEDVEYFPDMTAKTMVRQPAPPPPPKKRKIFRFDPEVTVFPSKPQSSSRIRFFESKPKPETRPLRTQNRRQPGRSFKRGRRTYKPTPWTVPEGFEPLNTSGHKMEWMEWECLGERLDREERIEEEEKQKLNIGVAAGIFVGVGVLVGGSQWVLRK